MWRSKNATCSGGTPANQLIYTGRCKYGGMTIYDDGTNKPTITIYDGITAAGRELSPAYEYPVAVGINGYLVPADEGEEANIGIYVDITCAGAVKVKVWYK
jgi:hypothetical protein